MPADRVRRIHTPGTVPEHGDPDRKRVLNVLAQRRYRQRRREKLAALEAQLNSAGITHESNHTITVAGPSDLTEAIYPSTIENDSATGIEGAVRSYDNCSTLTFDQDPLTLDMLQDFQGNGCLPSPIPSTPSSSSYLHIPMTPDGAVLSIPLLSVLHAFASLATAFDVTQKIWDPTHLHVLPRSISPAVALLPSNLHPVPAQLTIPHHPLLDLLPWPSVREKLICMLSLPSAFRPPVAREDNADNIDSCFPFSGDLNAPSNPNAMGITGSVKQSTAIVQLAQDLDDLQDGGGVRVHGNTSTWNQGNELIEEAWEIGEMFYKKWWWCIDQKVVESSNRRRRERGLPRLRWTA